jgi:hypothetical protein
MPTVEIIISIQGAVGLKCIWCVKSWEVDQIVVNIRMHVRPPAHASIPALVSYAV